MGKFSFPQKHTLQKVLVEMIDPLIKHFTTFRPTFKKLSNQLTISMKFHKIKIFLLLFLVPSIWIFVPTY